MLMEMFSDSPKILRYQSTPMTGLGDGEMVPCHFLTIYKRSLDSATCFLGRELPVKGLVKRNTSYTLF